MWRLQRLFEIAHSNIWTQYLEEFCTCIFKPKWCYSFSVRGGFFLFICDSSCGALYFTLADSQKGGCSFDKFSEVLKYLSEHIIARVHNTNSNNHLRSI